MDDFDGEFMAGLERDTADEATETQRDYSHERFLKQCG